MKILTSMLATAALWFSIPAFAQDFSIQFGPDGIRIQQQNDDVRWDDRCNHRRFYFDNRQFCDDQRHNDRDRRWSNDWDRRCNNPAFYNDYRRWCDRQLRRDEPVQRWDSRCNNPRFYDDYRQWCDRQRPGFNRQRPRWDRR